MKRNLLVLLMSLFLYIGHSQEAYQAPELNQCNNEVFDLTVQIPTILGNQDPENFSVLFFTTLADAQAGVNPILNPSAYVLATWPRQTIFGRVSDNNSSQFATTSFDIVISTSSYTVANVTACASYTLPALPQGLLYYTAPNGGGTTLPAGMQITTTLPVYIYGYQSNSTCLVSTQFLVSILNSGVSQQQDVISCGSYNLPALPVGNYYTSPGGPTAGGQMISPGTMITQSSTIYIYAQNGSCSAEDSFIVTIVPVPVTPAIQDVVICSSIYTLPPPVSGVRYFRLPGGPATVGNTEFFPGEVISETTTVYCFASSGQCSSESVFTVTIIQTDALNEEPRTLVSCEIPGLEGTAYFDLSAMSEQIANNFSVRPIFTYHLTLVDAENYVNPITNIHTFLNVITYSQTVYVRVETPCSSYIIPVILQVVDCTAEADITGIVRRDENGDGCDASDAPVPGIVVGYNIGNYVQYTYTDENGNYSFYGVTEGQGNIWIQNINGQNFLATPTSLPITYSGTLLQNDFCLAVPDPVNDVAAILSPYTQSIPGFQTSYYVAAFNAGNVASASGTLTLTFNPALVSLSNAGGGVVSGNTITWTYTNLQPQASVGFTVTFTIAAPPTVVSGTHLPYSLTVTNSGTDANPANNTYALTQTAVNSYDPNDITVKEGEYITIDQADDYLHYTIRFQNSGTANAQKVRIALPLDANLNNNTFQPLTASHAYRANRTPEAVEFIFDNINLPYESADEQGSHGFVTFRIKPAFGIAVGDSMNETASIYFDFNEAIVTNTATTTVTTVSATDVVNAKTFSLLPNPANGKVRVVTSEGLNGNAIITVTDMLGKKLINQSLSADGYVNINSLSAGVYMVSLTNGTTITTQKLLVK